MSEILTAPWRYVPSGFSDDGHFIEARVVAVLDNDDTKTVAVLATGNDEALTGPAIVSLHNDAGWSAYVDLTVENAALREALAAKTEECERLTACYQAAHASEEQRLVSLRAAEARVAELEAELQEAAAILAGHMDALPRSGFTYRSDEQDEWREILQKRAAKAKEVKP